ncbi:unnamed protein product [Closterium sp. NIES-53]
MASLRVLAFDNEGRPIQSDTWLDDLQLYLLSESRDSVSLFDHTSRAAPAPPATADSATRSHWLTCDVAARLAIRNHLPLDLVSHLCTSDARYHAALPAEFLAKNPPPINHFLVLDPTDLTVDLLEQHLLADVGATLRFAFGLLSVCVHACVHGMPIMTKTADETSVVAVGAARGTHRMPFFVGCSPSPLAPSYASAAAVDILSTEDVGAASASAKRRSGKGKGGRGGGGGSKSGGGGSSGGSGGNGGGGSSGSGGGSGGVGGGGGGGGGSGGSGSGGSGGGRSGAPREGSGGGQRRRQQRRSETPSPQQLREWLFQRGASGGSVSCPYVICTGDRAGQTCRKSHTQHRCLSCLDDAWRAEFGDEVERPYWEELLSLLSQVLRLLRPCTPLHLTQVLHAVCFVTAPPSLLSLQLYRSDWLAPPGALSLPVPPLFSRVRRFRPAHRPAFTSPRSLRTWRCPPGRDGHYHHSWGSGSTPLLVSPPVAPDSFVAPPPGSPLLAMPSWHALPSSPASPCLPCVEGRQRAGPHSSSFSPTSAPLQTLPMDVWGPARVSGQGREHYFLLVVDGYTRYTTDFPLRSKGQVIDVLIPWIHAVCLQLREWFHEDLPILRLHSDRGGEFSTDLLQVCCRGEGILLSFTLLESPQNHGIAERHIGLVMELNLWPFAVPETSPTLRWTGKVGDASVFRVWVSGAFVRDTSADKLSARAIPCVFLGFSPNAPGWQFYHPTSRRVFPSQDVTFDELVSLYHLFPYHSAPPPPPPLFLAPGPPPVDPLPPKGPAPSGVSQVDPLLGTVLVEVALGSGATSGGAASRGAEPGGAGSRGAKPGGAEFGGARPGREELGGAEPVGVEPGEANSERAESKGAEPWGAASSGGPAGASPRLSPQQLRKWLVRRACLRSGATGAGGTRAAGAGGAGVTAGAGGPGGTAAAGPGGAHTRGTVAAETGGVGGAGARDPTEPGAAEAGGSGTSAAGAGGAGAGGAGAGVGGSGAGARARRAGAADPGSTLPLQPVSPVPVPSPYTEHSGCLTEHCEPASRPALPVRPSSRVPRSRPPPVPGMHAMALRPSSVPLRSPLPAPLASFLPEIPDPESNHARAASPTVSRLLVTAVTDPSFESAAASALVAELLDFAAACHLDYATTLVAESESASPPSVGGECALGTDVLEDRKEDFECLAAAVPRFASMLLAPEGDPYASDFPTPRSYVEAITGPYSSQWQAAMDAEMASWKSASTYVHEAPKLGANRVDGMWIFRVKRPMGSPPAFKARYDARGFSQRQGVDYFQTFSPTPKMTTLWVLLHVAAQRDYDLRRPVYGLCQAPREWHVKPTLAALGFAPSTADPSLFLRTDTSLPPFYVLVYVDDLVFATADIEALTLMKARRTITLTQSHMVHQVLQRFGFQFSSPQPTPLSTNHSL